MWFVRNGTASAVVVVVIITTIAREFQFRKQEKTNNVRNSLGHQHIKPWYCVEQHHRIYVRHNVDGNFTIRNSSPPPPPPTFPLRHFFLRSNEKFCLIPISFLERNVTGWHKNLFYPQSFITMLPLHFEFTLPREKYDDVRIVGIWLELCTDL